MRRSTFSPGAAAVLMVIGLGLGFSPFADAAESMKGADVQAAESERLAWFPEPSEMDMTVRPPVQPLAAPIESLQSSSNEHALIPLPPATWTGLAGLAVLALPTCRRVLHRIVR